LKGLRNPKKYEYRGQMLQMAEILALPECTKSRNNIRAHLLKGKTLEEIFAVEVAPAKAKKIKRDKAKEEAEKARMAERERIKRIMSTPVNPKATQAHYMHQTPLRGDEVEPIRLKQNAYTVGY
jgi:hypothetical protein